MPLSPGDLLANKYRIEAEIGRGAFGRVYRARDIALDRLIAINELHRARTRTAPHASDDCVRRCECP
jgi:serine/threonine protein kinase